MICTFNHHIYIYICRYCDTCIRTEPVVGQDYLVVMVECDLRTKQTFRSLRDMVCRSRIMDKIRIMNV